MVDREEPEEEAPPIRKLGARETCLNSPEVRGALAKKLIKLFNHWGLSASDQLELLGLSARSSVVLEEYAKGEPLPEGGDSIVRACWLLSIHKSLGILYPYNPEIRYTWVNRRNAAFENLTPLVVMKKQGIVGLARVSRYLEYYQGI